MKNPVLSFTRVPQIVYLHTNMNIQKHTLCHCTLFLSLYINKYVCLGRIYTPILWPPHAKSWLIGKASDAGRDWGQEEKETTENEMAGWHHQLVGGEFEWTPGVGDGQGGLECCDSWGRKESDTTEWLNWIFTVYPHTSVFPFFLCLCNLFFSAFLSWLHWFFSLYVSQSVVCNKNGTFGNFVGALLLVPKLEVCLIGRNQSVLLSMG